MTRHKGGRGDSYCHCGVMREGGGQKWLNLESYDLWMLPYTLNVVSQAKDVPGVTISGDQFFSRLASFFHSNQIPEFS